MQGEDGDKKFLEHSIFGREGVVKQNGCSRKGRKGRKCPKWPISADEIGDLEKFPLIERIW